jgi:hypothetical protein
VKKREADPIAQYLNPFGGDAGLDEPLLQPARNRHQTIGMLCRPADPLPRNHTPRDDIEVATSGGDDNRAAKDAPEQDCSRPVRVEIVRVDQVEMTTVDDLLSQKRQDRGKEAKRRRAHPDLGQNRIARMVDMQPVARLFPWDAGKQRVSSEPRRGKRKAFRF